MSAGLGKVFESWRQHAPAFLVNIETPAGVTGSGIQIDLHHIVTCVHVVCREQDAYAYKEQLGRFPDALREVVSIRCGRFASQGTVVAQHEELDLAVLRLATPRPGVTPPLPLEAGLYDNVCVVGLKRMAERLDVLLNPIKIEVPPASQGNTRTQQKHIYGAVEGASGGGVFAEQGGAIGFLGIATLGGEGYLMGSFIPVEAVLEFVQQKLGIQHCSPSYNSAHALLARGVAPTWEFTGSAPELRLPFTAIARDETDTTASVSFISRRVVSAREARLKSQQRILPGHWRLPAWSDSIEDAESAIRNLGALVGTRFRLPTPDELEISWRGSDSSRAIEGRPTTLSDFAVNGRGIEIPPPGMAEWARDRNGVAFAFERNGDGGALSMVAVPLDQAAVWQPCFRMAFDIEGT